MHFSDKAHTDTDCTIRNQLIRLPVSLPGAWSCTPTLLGTESWLKIAIVFLSCLKCYQHLERAKTWTTFFDWSAFSLIIFSKRWISLGMRESLNPRINAHFLELTISVNSIFVYKQSIKQSTKIWPSPKAVPKNHDPTRSVHDGRLLGLFLPQPPKNGSFWLQTYPGSVKFSKTWQKYKQELLDLFM